MFGQIHPLVARNYGVDGDFFAAELSFEALFEVLGGDPVYVTELEVEGADDCVYFYRYRGSPTIILRSGTTVIRANLDVLGEERKLDVQQIAETLLSQIQR